MEASLSVAAPYIVSVASFLGYGISADGRAWSRWQQKNRPGFGKGAMAVLTDSWRELRAHPSPNDRYLRVVFQIDSKRTTKKIHQLVAEAFHGPRPAGMVCRHLDGNKTNNQAENLVWGTRSENEADKKTHGTAAVGIRNGRSRLSPEKVTGIRAMLKAGHGVTVISKAFGVHPRTIHGVRSGEVWGWLPDGDPVGRADDPECSDVGRMAHVGSDLTRHDLRGVGR